MNTTELLVAYREYTAAYAKWHAGFDLVNILDMPEAPQMSTAAVAGEIICNRGSVMAALVEAHAGIEDPDCPEWRKDAYQLIIEADR